MLALHRQARGVVTGIRTQDNRTIVGIFMGLGTRKILLIWGLESISLIKS
jgi:hypothetical protein